MTEKIEIGATILLSIAAAAVALGELTFGLRVWDTWGGRLVVLAALVVAGLVDLGEKRVPTCVSRPLLVGALGRLLAPLNVPALGLLAIAMLDLQLRPGLLERGVHAALFGLGLYLGLNRFGAAYFVPVAVILLAYYMWRANWIGGGDGKLLIALSALAPDPRLLLAVAAGWLGVGTIWTIRVYGKSFLTALSASLKAPRRKVSRMELNERGVPMTLGITAGWAIYLCLAALGA